MTKLSFRRQGHGLYPSDDATMEWLESVQQGIDIVGDLRVPRNATNHRHMFAILNEAVHNIDGFANVEDLLEYLKLEAGMYKVVGHASGVNIKEILKEGWGKAGEFQSPTELLRWLWDMVKLKKYTISREIIVYESLKFESMDEVRFKRVKARFLWILQDKFGFEPSELEERAMSQLAAYGAAAKRERK